MPFAATAADYIDKVEGSVYWKKILLDKPKLYSVVMTNKHVSKIRP